MTGIESISPMWVWIVGTLALAILLVSPIVRSALAWVFSAPGKLMFQWAIYLITRLFHAHVTVIKNLVLPRSVIYPTLDTQDRVRKD